MKILYHHRTQAEDGQAVHIRALIRAFEAAGHQVREVGLVKRAQEEQAGNGAGAKNGSGWGWIGRAPRFARELMEYGYNSVARHNIELPTTTNTRVAAIFGWNNIHRDDNVEDKDAKLAALLIETHFASTTANLDIAYVHSDPSAGRSIHAGLSFIQRIVWVYTSFRALISHNFDGESSQASNGALLFAELNWVPPHTHNNLYLNAFVGIDEFSSAARGPATGGPLGRTGILFGAVGIGSYAAPLGNGVGDAAGAALGYQMFFAGNRRSLTVEVGGRDGWGDSERSGVAMGFRLEQAIGRRVIARTDAFAGHRGNGNLGWGARVELLLKF